MIAWIAIVVAAGLMLRRPRTADGFMWLALLLDGIGLAVSVQDLTIGTGLELLGLAIALTRLVQASRRLARLRREIGALEAEHRGDE